MLRREFLQGTVASSLALGMGGCRALRSPESQALFVNDIQSQLNLTRVHEIDTPASINELAESVWRARRSGQPLAICGGRHAMGGQQFAMDGTLIDTTTLARVLALDRERGLVTVESGMQWPALIKELHALQPRDPQPWTIREKQSGVDGVTIGGSMASNIHGRGLSYPPFISAIESFRLVDARGDVQEVSRSSNPELFSVVIGGYGLFGIVSDVTLRLVRRFKVERMVELTPIRDLLDKVARRVEEGFVFGDCQYAIDIERDADEHPGIFSCYRPIGLEFPINAGQKGLAAADWAALYELSRTNKAQAFQRYSSYYLTTSGQRYWSDTHQLAGDFFRGYQQGRKRLSGSEIITEVYVAPENFLDFMLAARSKLLERRADVVFGTIRFIKQDEESFLAWAPQDSVCVICNLHVEHDSAGVSKVAEDFRAIIDCVLRFGGRYYLTYHRFAAVRQLLRAYPQFPEFLSLKQKYDAHEIFQSDWYRHYRRL